MIAMDSGKEEAFVADGKSRVIPPSKEELARIRKEVEEKYADDLKGAGLWRRIKIRRQMKREVEEKAGIPSSGSLFASKNQENADPTAPWWNQKL